MKIPKQLYEMLQRGILNIDDMGFVPDVYTHNQLLDNRIASLKKELENYKAASHKAGEILIKLRKERDFHRMHHKRVAQEKNKLINDIKRLKKHYASYEPTLSELTNKYHNALKQKMLTSLEKDRAVGQLSGLQATLRTMNCGQDNIIPLISGYKTYRECKTFACTQKTVNEIRGQKNDEPSNDSRELPKKPQKTVEQKHSKDSEFPRDTRVNPYLAQMKRKPNNLLRSGECRMTKTLKLHELAVSCLSLHPRKEILVTGSDDRLWKMWSIPNGDIIMTGEGHADWLSGCSFHPSGNLLATVSGDSTVKIWNFLKTDCLLTFKGHLSSIWGCSWHTCGDFVASCSMDKTSKIWDIHSERCRYTLRGHVSSVNSIEFVPFSNSLLTSSADKTISLWDGRTGLCAQTFFGHVHSCNYATMNLKSDTIVSCDSSGIVKLWDMRRVALMLTVDVGSHSANQVVFHSSGQLVVVASDDGTVKILDLPSSQLSSLAGHEDAVQCVLFDHKGEYVISGGSDGTVRFWT
ncbi:sperm-associated antigen 16 protein isoform X2 [Callorhinchus milii]|uniref:sperm-associated antigen 16 protein isoform X2 n=1 Tax=Callorhinchus milii TaxID=7868 RepID=UPI001C3FEB77|nr:sperm-associated antigen 16 protein isoform X2 [Callorhinchus milii]